MTSRHLEYTLDRLLTRQTSIPGPEIADPTYRFDSKVTGVTNISGPGIWSVSGVNLYVYEEDADDVALPMAGSLTLDDTSIVHIVAGSYNLATTLLVYNIGVNPLGTGIPNTRRLELAEAPVFPAGNDLTISIPTGAEPMVITGTKQVWCTRLDFRGRDQLNIGDGSHFTLADTRIIVRNDGTWSNSDLFTLEGGNYTVRGVSAIGGRKQYLELLARTS